MLKSKTLLVAALAVALSGCNSQAVKPQADAEMTKPAVSAVADMNNSDLYEVHHEGRLYVFDDFDTYQNFLQVGETAYRQTFIGAGPDGQTLVFGVTGKDKKKPVEQIAAYNLYNGKLTAAEPFYGEMRAEGRIYVFDRLEDMATVRTLGEAPLRYTEIGNGPQGETVVYVLRSENKKQKPHALQTAFKQRNGLI